MTITECDGVRHKCVSLSLKEVIIELNFVGLPLGVHLPTVSQEVLCVPERSLDPS